MKKDKFISVINKILPFVIVAILAGALYVFAPICDHLIELKNGNMTHMKCYYTGEAAKIVLVILIAIGIENIRNKVSYIIPLVFIGILFLVIPTWIGLCGNTEMACHRTALWIRISGVLTIISGLLSAYSASKRNEL